MIQPAEKYAVFSPDSRLLAVPYGEVVSLWDVSDRQNPRRLEPPLQVPAQSVAFVPQTPLVVTLTAGGQVQLWDIADPTGPFAIDVLPASETVTGLSFSPNWLMATTDSAGVVTMWDISRLVRFATDPLARACAIAGRGLTAAEWTQYLPDDPHVDTCPPG